MRMGLAGCNGVVLFVDGFGYSEIYQAQLGQLGQSPSPLKKQIIGGLHAAPYLRMPLMFANVLVILVKLVFG